MLALAILQQIFRNCNNPSHVEQCESGSTPHTYITKFTAQYPSSANCTDYVKDHFCQEYLL